MELKGRLLWFATLGILANGIFYFMGFWMPKLLIVSIAFLIVGYVLPSDDASKM